MANTRYLHPNVSAVIVETDVKVPEIVPTTNLFCPIISEKGLDRKVKYITSVEDFIFEYGYPDFNRYGQASYNAYRALQAGAGVHVLRCTPEYLDVNSLPVLGSATYANIVIGLGFDLTSGTNVLTSYSVKPIVKYVENAYNITDIEAALGKSTVDTFTEYNFLALYPRGRGETLNNIGITLTPIQGRYADTYPWYMYSLTVYRANKGIVSKLENFIVSFDPNSKSVTGQSYYILDILNKFSQYLTGSFSEVTWDVIETDIGIPASNFNVVESTPFKIDTLHTYGYKPLDVSDVIVPNTLVFNKVTATVAISGTFTSLAHTLVDDDTITFTTVTGVTSITVNTPYFIINSTADTFEISDTLGGTAIVINIAGVVTYHKQTLTYLTIADLPLIDLGFINGVNRIPYLKYGYDGKYTDDGLVNGAIVKSRLYKSGTYDAMLIKAYTGLYEAAITQTNMSEVDLVLDADFSVPVKQAMIDFSQQYRKDCFTILDTNIGNTYMDYLDYRNNLLISLDENDELQVTKVDTRFSAIFAGDRYTYDTLTKKNIPVTLTYYLASLIPTNDKLHGLGKNFVGVNRSVITDYVEGLGSEYFTEPQKEELYNNQVNYLTKTFKDLYFDSQETTLTKASPMGEISKARAYLRIERIAKSICNKTQWEFATKEVYKNLESSLSLALEPFVKDGTCEYITPTVWADDYAKANKLLYVYVELRFTDIIERVEISFNVAR